VADSPCLRLKKRSAAPSGVSVANSTRKSKSLVWALKVGRVAEPKRSSRATWLRRHSSAICACLRLTDSTAAGFAAGFLIEQGL